MNGEQAIRELHVDAISRHRLSLPCRTLLNNEGTALLTHRRRRYCARYPSNSRLRVTCILRIGSEAYEKARRIRRNAIPLRAGKIDDDSRGGRRGREQAHANFVHFTAAHSNSAQTTTRSSVGKVDNQALWAGDHLRLRRNLSAGLNS